jgi:hypothetical protein
MIKELIKLATELDNFGNISEANKVDLLLKKYAQVSSESNLPQAASAPVMSKAELRLQEQEKNGKYFIMLYTPTGQYTVGMFKMSELPTLMSEIISGKRAVEEATPGDKYTADQFVIKTYGLVDGKAKMIREERLIESPLAKDILGKLKSLPSAPPPKVLSPAEKIIEEGYNSYKVKLKQCVTTAVNANPNFAASTVISFTVNKDGSTSNHKAVSTPANPGFDSCLVSQMPSWSFGRISLNPNPRYGEVSIESPINVSYKQKFGREK